MSPTVYEVKNLKFRIYFKDHNPPHVHVDGKGARAVFSLHSGECVRNSGFSEIALKEIKKLVVEKKGIFMEAWNDYQK